ncbi:hypothetical protein [Streptomyces sp. V1I6]|uniref:hypothetical protein n=1 Tax=Streptomyces sp. V1I6 TaxID=3042273 RepID=UPI002786A344|nr:hypothetical protein [Streptomyces sp. V1I6]MDQ0842423.1 hypothetical protein [Streptomyces sp. V1I6]
MHAYLITAKPGPIRRLLTTIRTWTVRLLAALAMTLLGLLVLAIRCTRPVVNYLAVRAVWLEAWASKVTGLPQVGAVVGEGLTDEFMREFRKHARPTQTAGSTR